MLTNLVEIGHAVSINELGYSKKKTASSSKLKNLTYVIIENTEKRRRTLVALATCLIYDVI